MSSGTAQSFPSLSLSTTSSSAPKLSFSFGSSSSSLRRAPLPPPLPSAARLVQPDDDADCAAASVRVHDDASSSFSSLSTLSSPPPPVYIIPMKNTNTWRDRHKQHTEQKQQPTRGGVDPSTNSAPPSSAEPSIPLSLDQQAERALLDEAKQSTNPTPTLPSSLYSTLTILPPPASSSLTPSPPTPTSPPSYSIPIAEFGVAMLRGMGWRGPGDGVGGANKADVQPVVLKRRDDRSGLGADQDKGVKATKVEVEGKGRVREESAAMKLKAKAGSRVLSLHSQQLRVGALVSVIAGRYRRQYGRVKEVEEEGAKDGKEGVVRCEVKLNGDERRVWIDSRDVEVLDERSLPTDHPAFGRRPESSRVEEKKEDTESPNKRQKTERNKEPITQDRREERKDRGSSSSSSRVLWCRPHLRVRLISRSSHGADYRQKGVVIDVADASHISVRLSDGRVVDRLREDQLETVIPSVNGRVMALRGEHKGEVGELIDKDGDRGKATVQLEAELTVVQLNFDDVCEYV